MAVDVDLDGEGKPGLQAHVHQAEVAVEVVEVQAEATRLGADQPGPLFAVAELKALGLFEDGKDADQAFGEAVAFGDLAGFVVLADGAGQVLIRATGLGGELLGVALRRSD